MTTGVPACPDPLPPAISDTLAELAHDWFGDSTYPRVDPTVVLSWRVLLREWLSDSSLPLYVRKGRLPRGAPVVHENGREVVPCDNSAAHYALRTAPLARR